MQLPMLFMKQNKNMLTGTIYMHKNKINNKCYIGQTVKNPPEKRWQGKGSGYTNKNTKFFRAIWKYGWDNFEHIILEENIKNLTEANEKEKYWIAYYNATDKNKGYNCTTGGNEGSTWSEEAKRAQSERFKGENGSFYGKQHTQEYKENMRQQMINKWNNPKYKKQVCENMRKNHADVKGGKNPQAKKVKRIDDSVIYGCAGEAAVSIGKDYVQGGKSIARCCRGERNTAYGYKWEFVIEEKGDN